MALTYKDIGIENEPTFGVSVLGTANRLHVKNVDFTGTFGKQQIAHHETANKGDRQSLLQNSRTNGSIDLYATINNLHQAFELITTSLGVTNTIGNSAISLSFYQSTTDSLKTKCINLDRDATQEKLSGVIADGFEMSAVGTDKVNINLSCQSRGVLPGVSMAGAIGETLPPFIFADVHLYMNEGATFGVSTFEVKASEWRLSYRINAKQVFRWHSENDRSVSRFLLEKPQLSGSIQIVHEGATFVPSSYGVSYWYLRIEGKLPDYVGQVAGVTPYMFQIDIPKITITSAIRKYEQASVSVETLNYNAHFDSGVSAMWLPKIVKGYN